MGWSDEAIVEERVEQTLRDKKKNRMFPSRSER